MPELPTAVQPLPRTGWGWVVAVVVASGAFGFGLYSYYDHAEHGFIVSAMRNPGQGGAAWGMSIIFDVFFVGIAFSGIAISSMCRLFHIKALEPVTRLAQLLTVACVLAAAGCVLSDLGRPLDGLMKLPRYANPNSPFYGTFTLVVSGFLFASLVFLFLDGRADAAATAPNARRLKIFYRLWAAGWRDSDGERARHHWITFVLALGIVPLLVIAPSTLGFIFGIQAGRPGWYSSLQAPSFVVLSAVSGVGALLLVTISVRRLLRLHDRIPDVTLRWLGNLLWMLTAIYFYFMIVEELTSSYAAPEADRRIAHLISRGPFAPLFWITVGGLALAFLVPFVLYLQRRISVGWLVVAAVGSLTAAMLKRFLLVVPSQTHGALTPTDPGRLYDPTWAEYGVVVGLFGLVALVILVFVRIFPIVPTPPTARTWTRPPRDLLRLALTWLTAFVGVGLIVLGLADSFRLFSGGEIDPRIPFSPILFATGVMVTFASAVVYEIVPDKKP